jgi:hypothetical protein
VVQPVPQFRRQARERFRTSSRPGREAGHREESQRRGRRARHLEVGQVRPVARLQQRERGRRGRERRQERRREAPQSARAIGLPRRDAPRRVRDNADRSPAARGRARARSRDERASPCRRGRDPGRHARRRAPPRRARREDCGSSTATGGVRSASKFSHVPDDSCTDSSLFSSRSVPGGKKNEKRALNTRSRHSPRRGERRTRRTRSPAPIRDPVAQAGGPSARAV